MPVTINFSFQATLTSGRVTVTPTARLVDYEPATPRLLLPAFSIATATITNGVGAVNVPPGDQNGQKVAYDFLVERSDGAGGWVLFDKTTALVKSTPTTVPYYQLDQAFQTADQLDQSIVTIADLVTREPFLSRLPKGFENRGLWSVTEFYKQNDLVSRDGRLWRYRLQTQQQNIDPLDPANQFPGNNAGAWELSVDKGAAGGTGALTVGYSHSNFATMTADAASRSDLQGGVSYAIANSAPDLSAYAKLSGANFTGNVAAPNATANTHVLNRQTADARFLAIARTASPIGFARLATNNILTPVGSNALTVIVYNSRPFTTGNIINNVGDVTVTETGLYLLIWSFAVSIYSNFNGTAQRIRFRALLNRFTGAPTGSQGEIVRFEHSTLTNGGTIEQQMTGARVESFTAGQGYNTQFSLNAGEADGAGNSAQASMLAQPARTWLGIWRLNDFPTP